MRFSISMLAAALLLTFGCNKQAREQQSSQALSESTSSTESVDRANSAQIQERMENGLIGGEDDFPFVYQADGGVNWFEAYTLRFSLTTAEPWTPLVNRQVPWVNHELYNENNGNFATYVRSETRLSMEFPYIQVQYINKALPSCGTVDSVYMWLDGMFLQDPLATGDEKTRKLDTQSGKPALIKHYKVPQKGSGGKQFKYLAYAYIDVNEDYIVGLALTTQDEYYWQNSKTFFDNLVYSFNQ
ncbi:hypothetical protein [Pontibacter sp. G13]|uniref:hypothetical protein n=1 Tax=Pontibacter sp. G13 TaxID=3074898 RepID=UPI00288AEFB8|nr:hypothetical protein [Pontibacter sp. G13]WNJ21420.1 hypothetical protein RJD25_13205 [Pontibacter sp. G13]